MIRIISKPVSISQLREIAQKTYGNLVKAVVDINKGIITVGGELHADEEALLLEKGSRQEDLWGINLYPLKLKNEWIEFDSIINLRPSVGNLSRDVENPKIKEKIRQIVYLLIKN